MSERTGHRSLLSSATASRKVLIAVGLALLLAGPGVSSCGAPLSGRTEPADDIVLLTIDTLRWDATGFSGAGKVRTPFLDRLAGEGLIFPDAHAHAVTTLPSHASILTGLYPFRTGVRDNAGFVLPEGVVTIASILKSRGFRTGAFVSAFTLDGRFGLRRGFDVYDDRVEGYSPRLSTLAERPGEETARRAAEWWESQRGSRRFLWVHLFAPHFPYEPTGSFASEYRSAPYYGEAALADAQAAALLEPILREKPGTAVVFTSDHGEALGEHGERSHGIFAYEGTLRVPLAVRWTGHPRVGVDARPARHVDIAPTILAMAGVEPPNGIDGVSLLAPAGPDPGSYFEAMSAFLNRGWAPLYGFLQEGVKVIDLPVRELYRLAEDPSETRNLAGSQPELFRRLASKIPLEARETAPREVPDAEVTEKLRSLGYLASATSPSPRAAFDASSDPKNLVHLETEIDDAILRHRRGDAEGAVRALEAVLRREPRTAYVYSHLAYIHAEAGWLDRAIEVLSRAERLGIASEAMTAKLALAMVQAGRAAEARRLLARREASPDPGTQIALGRVAAAMGEIEEARARFERALEIDPTYPAARVDLGVLMIQQGRLDEARALLERATTENPFLPDGWNALGALRARAGNLGGAIEAWERAVRVNPRLAPAWLNLALAYRRSGDDAKAAAALERCLPYARGEARRRAEDLLRAMRRR